MGTETVIITMVFSSGVSYLSKSLVSIRQLQNSSIHLKIGTYSQTFLSRISMRQYIVQHLETIFLLK